MKDPKTGMDIAAANRICRRMRRIRKIEMNLVVNMHKMATDKYLPWWKRKLFSWVLIQILPYTIRFAPRSDVRGTFLDN